MDACQKSKGFTKCSILYTRELSASATRCYYIYTLPVFVVHRAPVAKFCIATTSLAEQKAFFPHKLYKSVKAQIWIFKKIL